MRLLLILLLASATQAEGFRLGSVGFVGSLGAATAGGGGAYTVNMLLAFDAGSDGDALTAAYVNANDIGTPPASWTISGFTGAVSTAQAQALITQVIVDSVTQSGSATRSFRFSLEADGWIEFQFPSAQRTNSMVMSGWFRTDVASPDNHTYDIAYMQNNFNGTSEFAIMQMATSGTADPTIKAHSSLGTGSNITMSRSTWYWWSLRNLKATSSDLTFYNTSGALVGTSSIGFGANPDGVRTVRIGNVNSHGATLVSGHFYFANVVPHWGAAPAYPVGP